MEVSMHPFFSIACVLAIMGVGNAVGAFKTTPAPSDRLGHVTLHTPPPASTPSLTLIPPAILTEQVTLDVRGAVRNHTLEPLAVEVIVYLDVEHPDHELHRQQLEVPPGSAKGVRFSWSARGQAGAHRMILASHGVEGVRRTEQAFEVVASPMRSRQQIDGAWIMFDVAKDAGGAPFRDACRRLTDAQWVEMVQGMWALGMHLIVIECAFDNFSCYYGTHTIERDGYKGLAYYPSRLFPGRAGLAAVNPIEAILTEADRLGMQVFLGVGLYAWYDHSLASLAWHKQVVNELYEQFGEHPSLYGWYVTEESEGSLAFAPAQQARTVEFMRQFQAHCHELTPDKPVMLATSAGCVSFIPDAWRQLLPYCDIVAPFGFGRAAVYDIPVDQNIRWWQSACNAAGTHLWLDEEVFLFGPGFTLVPRPIDAIVEELDAFRNFEKVLCFQYPALLSAPWASSHPGGPASVALYQNYETYLAFGRDYWRYVPPESLRLRVQHDAIGKPVRYQWQGWPTDLYQGGGLGGLTDGLLANREHPFHEDTQWQGFHGKDLDVIIDLGRSMALARISSDYLSKVGAGIYLPQLVEYAVGDNPTHFRTVAVLRPGLCTEPEAFVRSFPARLKEISGRYLRVRAAHLQTIPPGKPGAGHEGWLFVDEILVEEAPAARGSRSSSDAAN
jgi:hypothetical protein